MEYLQLTQENLEQENICCANSNAKDVQALSKKEWLKERLEEGLVFLKSEQRGKCFIEYMPAENAWVPLDASEYMYIHCFWVSGAFKGHGYSNDLLSACIKDSKEKGKKGLCILSSDKKRPFLSDPKHLAYKGFQIADTSDIGMHLLYLPFDVSAPVPQFKEHAKHPQIKEKGFVLYYTHQCPYNAKYAPLIAQIALQNSIPFKLVHIQTKEQAQALPCPCTSYALFYDGKFITNEVLSEKKFLQLAQTI